MTDPILSNLEAAVVQILAAPINNALASLQANPTALNVAAQGVALQGALIGAAPALETLGIKDGAALLQEKFNSYIAGLLPTPSPAPAPTA